MDLNGVGNIADRFAKRLAPSWNCTMDVDDGYLVHAPVGSLRPNGYGLHDVHGGVWEWCLDSYTGYETAIEGPNGLRSDDPSASLRVGRGGSFSNPATRARSAHRNRDTPVGRNNDLGLRPSRVIED